MQSVTQSFSVTYEADPGSVAEVRHALAEFAQDAGATPEQVDGVRLAVSEAVTNAVLHAYRGGPGAIQVTAALAEGAELWILVADDGAGMQPNAERPGLGLGLGLISQVSDEMAIVPRSGGGVEVRMRFTLTAATGGEATPAGGLGTPAVEMGIGRPDALAAMPHSPVCD